jgi:hypothetical protein
MAIFTISANTNYSAIKGSLANGDTIRINTNAVRLTIDEAPLLTNITVDSPGVSGRMTVSGAYDMSTWSIIAGTVALIDGTFPSGATLGSVSGGTSANAHGVATNSGTITTANGGSASNANGVNTNNGTVTTANGGTNAAHGVNTNNGIVTTANGGTFSNSHGVSLNNGTVTTATGGSGSITYGVNTNNGTVTTANGGSNATDYGVNTNNNLVLNASDNTGFGVNLSARGVKFVIGPTYASRIVSTGQTSPVTTVYTLGPLNPAAELDPGIEVIEMSLGSGGGGGGAAFQLVGGGGLVY